MIAKVICGTKELIVNTRNEVHMHHDSPGTIIIGGNDLFDLGFSPEEITKAGGVIIQIGDCEIKIEDK